MDWWPADVSMHLLVCPACKTVEYFAMHFDINVTWITHHTLRRDEYSSYFPGEMLLQRSHLHKSCAV